MIRQDLVPWRCLRLVICACYVGVLGDRLGINGWTRLQRRWRDWLWPSM